jgi:hypothetical protein
MEKRERVKRERGKKERGRREMVNLEDKFREREK